MSWGHWGCMRESGGVSVPLPPLPQCHRRSRPPHSHQQSSPSRVEWGPRQEGVGCALQKDRETATVQPRRFAIYAKRRGTHLVTVATLHRGPEAQVEVVAGGFKPPYGGGPYLLGQHPPDR